MPFKSQSMQVMVFKAFFLHLPFSSPWILLILIPSIVVYAGFHPLSFLLSCSTLLISTFALPLLRPYPTTSQIDTKTLIQEQEQEPIAQECLNKGDPDPVFDSYSTHDCSDGSISDEESLIEIELPSGYYIDPKKWCYSIESFQQQNLMAELLAEINEYYEEENMIEIDLSMGLIKCPMLEIKA